MSGAKTVCSRHEVAYEVVASCPYCETPEPVLSFAKVQAALKEMWGPKAREAFEREYNRPSIFDSLAARGKALTIPVIVEDPYCPPDGCAHSVDGVTWFVNPRSVAAK